MIDTRPEHATSTRAVRSIFWIALSAVVAITPTVISLRGSDVFREPKTFFFQAGILAVAACLTAAALLSERLARSLSRPRVLLFAAAAILWTIVISFTALVPEVSVGAPFTIFAYSLLLWMAVELSRDGSLLVGLAAVLVPAIVNASIVALQASAVWQPFRIVAGPEKLGNIGLIGNPNTAGTYLLVPTIVAIACAIVPGRFRFLFAAIAALLLVAIVQVQTLTVLLALGASILGFALIAGPRARRLALAALAIGAVGFFAWGPTRTRAIGLVELAQSGDYASLSSGRLPATVTALSMFISRPVTGVGPGGFAARYMDYRVALDDRFPEWMRPIGEPYQQAHNDHAELLAEGGIPAYLLFLAFLAGVARLTFRSREDESEKQRLARTLAFPAALGFAVLTLGQFPLDLTAPTTVAVFTSGLCFGWSCDEGD